MNLTPVKLVEAVELEKRNPSTPALVAFARGARTLQNQQRPGRRPTLRPAESDATLNIRPIAAAERRLGGLDLFLLWAGVAISLAEIWAGGFLAPLGFWTGVSVVLLGHVLGNTLMALGGVIGSDHGIPSMVSVRPSFGIRGSNLAAVMNIVQLICWASIMLIIGGRAGAALGSDTGGLLAQDGFWIVTIGLGTLLWALLTGKKLWKILQAGAVVGLVLILLVMSWKSMHELRTSMRIPDSSEMSFMMGLDLVIAMPISWMPLVADYTRFASRSTTAFFSTWWGYFLVSSWMYVLGLGATLVSGSAEPQMQLLEILGSMGLVTLALFMVVLSTITSDFPDIYSATCSMLNVKEKLNSSAVMWAAGILSILLALVFPMERYESFLLFIGAMFIPLFGIVLTDYFLIRRRRLDLEDLYEQGGAYWYVKGVNPVAIGSFVLGFATYLLMTSASPSFGASLPSMLVAGVCYYTITKWWQKAPSPHV